LLSILKLLFDDFKEVVDIELAILAS